MAKIDTLTPITSPYGSKQAINDNNTKLENALLNTLSLDGSLPNSMAADLDMDSNNILNVDSIDVISLTIGSDTITDIADLIGPVGPTGPQGIPGNDGADGADGVDGATGPQGPPGINTWGSITGTLGDQTDLDTALDSKAAIAGQVFTGAISATNLSGTNTGDQTITLTGEITGSGTGSFVTTIANDAVTYAKMQPTSLGNVVLGKSGAAGDITEIQLGTNQFLGRNASNITPISIDSTLTITASTLGVTSGTYADASHTHTASQVTDFSEAVDDRVGALIVAGTNITATYNDGAGTLTIDAAGGSPGGSTTQVQFNNAGTFGASADLTFDDSTNTLALPGTDTRIDVTGVTNTPSAPSSGIMRMYGKPFVGRVIPAWVDSIFEGGLTQSALFDGRHRFLWTVANSSTGITAMGDTVAVSGTHAIRGAQSPWTGVHAFPTYSGFANIITVPNQAIGLGGNNFTFYRSATAGSQGGFLHYCRWGYDTWTNGGRHFNGYTSDSSAVITGDPSARDQTVGFAVDAADNGLIHFLTRGTAATKTSTGLTTVSGKGYHTWFYAPFNSNNIYWRIQDVETGTVAEGVSTTNLPAVDNRLVVAVRTSNAALTPATSVRLGIAMIYGESAQ